MENSSKQVATKDRFLSVVLLAGFLLMAGCTFSSSSKQDSIRIVEYQLNGVHVTRMDNTITEKSYFFMGDYEALVQKRPEVTIDWSISHEMAGWLLFKNDSVAIVPQIGLGTKTNERGNSIALMDYEDCWLLSLTDYEKSIWCIGSCKGCDGGELVNCESALTKLHFPNSMVIAIPINEEQVCPEN